MPTEYYEIQAIELLSMLSKKERQCFLIYNIQRKTIRDIGVELGISRSAVHTNIERAKLKMSQKIDGVEITFDSFEKSRMNIYESIDVLAEILQMNIINSRYRKLLFNEARLKEVIESLFTSEKKEAEVIKTLSRLSYRERQCYLIYTSQKKSFKTIGTELGISKSAVQEYIERAREKLKA